ncbi:MAG: O-antigen ligase family protein [Candidatus Cloacimonetes bacterium]|nr:O-antigen ligase family protein [Candidatus Cloacimonadota bacterium]
MNFKELANYHMRLSLVGNPIGVGRIFSILSLISIICLFYEKNNYKKIFYILCTILGLIITISTNSRGPFFALIISILIYLFFFTKLNMKKIVYALILISLLFIIIFSLLPESLISRYKLFGNKEVHISKKQVSVFNTFIIRENYIKKSLAYLNENPEKLIFGVGLGGFSYIITNRDIRAYPHNIFVEIILELGIIGLVLFILPFLFLLNDFILTKNKINESEYGQIIFWIMLTVLFLLNAQVSGDINDNRLLWFFQGGVVGLILQYKKKKTYDIIK